MGARTRTRHSLQDNVWKEILDAYLEQFLSFFFPKVHADIDWSRPLVPLDKELVQMVRDSELGTRFVDKLVKVFLANGAETWLLIHIEVQGRAEDGFDERMFVYNYRIFDRYHREVISVAVLTDLDDDFRPGLYERQRWDCGVRFWFPVVKIVDYAKQWIQLEANLNPFALVVLAYLGATRTRDQKQRLAWKVRLVRMLYERGYNREEVVALFRFIDWLLILPAGLEEQFRDEVEKMEKGEKMAYVTSIERLGIEKGERLGIEKGERLGIEKGERLGIEKGERLGLIEAIDLGLSMRFPSQATELLARARRIEAIERLKAITRALKGGEPLEAIEALLGSA